MDPDKLSGSRDDAAATARPPTCGFLAFLAGFLYLTLCLCTSRDLYLKNKIRRISGSLLGPTQMMNGKAHIFFFFMILDVRGLFPNLISERKKEF